jgi:FkbM family methyltransferase
LIKVSGDIVSSPEKTTPVTAEEFHQLRQQMNRIERMLGEIGRLVGPMGVPRPDGTLLIQTIWGHKVIVDATDLVMTPQLVVYREWERDISTLIHQFVGPDTVFVDVGANLGYFTCLAGTKMGNRGSGRIIAVEPNPHMISLIRRNIEINWSMAPIVLLEMGASDHEGTVDLVLPRDHLANAAIAIWGAQDAEAVPVPVQPLDVVLSDIANIDLMKIDVEGYELFVLKGARQIIARSRDIRIILEWSKGQLSMTGTLPEDMIALFQEMGLAAYSLPNSLTDFDAPSHRLSPDDLRNLEYTNILLMKADG